MIIADSRFWIGFPGVHFSGAFCCQHPGQLLENAPAASSISSWWGNHRQLVGVVRLRRGVTPCRGVL